MRAGHVARVTSSGPASHTAFVFGLASLAVLFSSMWENAGPTLRVYVRRGRIVRVRLSA